MICVNLRLSHWRVIRKTLCAMRLAQFPWHPLHLCSSPRGIPTRPRTSCSPEALFHRARYHFPIYSLKLNRSFQISLPRFLVLFFFLLLSALVAAHTEARANTIDLQIQPGLDNIRPLAKQARLTLTLHDSAGKAIDGSQFQIRLYAPPRGMFISTDFPQVEGTPLLDIEL